MRELEGRNQPSGALLIFQGCEPSSPPHRLPLHRPDQNIVNINNHTANQSRFIEVDTWPKLSCVPTARDLYEGFDPYSTIILYAAYSLPTYVGNSWLLCDAGVPDHQGSASG